MRIGTREKRFKEGFVTQREERTRLLALVLTKKGAEAAECETDKEQVSVVISNQKN